MKQIKMVWFAFRGEPMCFTHVLLNALDLQRRGHDAKIVFEGEAVTLVQELQESGNRWFNEAKAAGIIAGICNACSEKMGVLEYNQSCGLPLLDEMNGHPAVATYLEQGYSVITL